jgi:hypothetical protein
MPSIQPKCEDWELNGDYSTKMGDVALKLSDKLCFTVVLKLMNMHFFH